MNDRRNEVSIWRVAVMLLAIALLLGPAMAGPKKKKRNKKRGGINPTNIAVIESDLDDGLVSAEAVDDHWFEDDEPADDHWFDDDAWELDDCDDDDDDDDDADAAHRIGAFDAHAVATGRGVWVAVLDAGFNLNHARLRENLAPLGFDAIDGDDNPEDLGNGWDDDGDGMADNAIGHGTFVAGMVLLAAPDATIVPVRVKDDEGWGTNEELVRGLEFAIAVGVDVINLSLDQASSQTSGLDAVIKKAQKSGIVVVISAGNDASTELARIAGLGDSVVACASDDDDRRAPFSNYSPDSRSAQIFAPGVDLYGPIGFPYEHAMGSWSGTSFSAGILSGAAALARERQPWLSTSDTRNLLADSVVPVRDLDGREMDGTGRIDLRLVVWR